MSAVRIARPAAVLAVLVLAALAGGCDEQHGPKIEDGVIQTGMPGQVSAGGGTSGQVIAQAGGSAKAVAPPAGTPGIPLGAGGNTGGTAMGGTSGEKAATGVPAGEGPQKAASAALDPGPAGVIAPGVSASAANTGLAVGGLSNVPGAVAGASSGAAAGGSNPASSPGPQR